MLSMIFLVYEKQDKLAFEQKQILQCLWQEVVRIVQQDFYYHLKKNITCVAFALCGYCLIVWLIYTNLYVYKVILCGFLWF